MSLLAEIFAHKRDEVADAKRRVSESDLRDAAAGLPAPLGFRDALSGSPHSVALVAEVKAASPSAGIIRSDFDPAAVARSYAAAGADCLSVLTDRKYFGGDKANVARAKAASGLPTLRKDFIDDPYQILEARAWGADAILLIAAALSPMQLSALQSFAREEALDVLVEVHDESELDMAVAAGADLIGVNNRDLSTFETSLGVSERLIPLLPPHVVAVAESAMSVRADIERMEAAGARAVLIGTAFCSSPDIGAKVRDVMGW